MLQKLFGVFLVLLLILFGWAFYNAAQKVRTNQGASPTPSGSALVASPSVFRSPEPTPSNGAGETPRPSASPTVRIRSVSIDVDNDGAGQAVVPALRGMIVRLTLNAMPVNTDPQGLRFASQVVSFGIILPGTSKTVEFTADQSFTLIPYAVSTGSQRPYTIQVSVQ